MQNSHRITRGAPARLLLRIVGLVAAIDNHARRWLGLTLKGAGHGRRSSALATPFWRCWRRRPLAGATLDALRRKKVAPPRWHAEGPGLADQPRATEAAERDTTANIRPPQSPGASFSIFDREAASASLKTGYRCTRAFYLNVSRPNERRPRVCASIASRPARSPLILC